MDSLSPRTSFYCTRSGSCVICFWRSGIFRVAVRVVCGGEVCSPAIIFKRLCCHLFSSSLLGFSLYSFFYAVLVGRRLVVPIKVTAVTAPAERVVRPGGFPGGMVKWVSPCPAMTGMVVTRRVPSPVFLGASNYTFLSVWCVGVTRGRVMVGLTI